MVLGSAPVLSPTRWTRRMENRDRSSMMYWGIVKVRCERIVPPFSGLYAYSVSRFNQVRRQFPALVEQHPVLAARRKEPVSRQLAEYPHLEQPPSSLEYRREVTIAKMDRPPARQNDPIPRIIIVEK